MKKFGINFKLALGSQIISLIGGNILRFSLLLFILDLSGSAGMFGIVTAASQIPVLLLSIPGGLIADRMNKKKMMVLLDGIKTVICFIILAVFLTGHYSVATVTALIVLFIANVTLFGPILTAAIPSIVDEAHLVEANGAISGVNALAELLSFVIGGVLFATIGIVNIIILAAIAFTISTILDLLIKIPFEKQIVLTGILATLKNDMKESIAYSVKKNPIIMRSAIVFSIGTFLLMPIFTVGAGYIIRINFEASDAMFGISQAMAAMGMLIGALLSGKVKALLKIKYLPKLLLATSFLCLGLAVSVYASLFSGHTIVPFWLFNLVSLLTFIVLTFINITVMSLIQEQVPGHLLGKVLALLITFSNLATPIGQSLFGTLMDTLSSSLPLLFIAIAILLTLVATIAKRMFQTKSENEELVTQNALLHLK